MSAIKLHYHLRRAPQPTSQLPVIMSHGLFGSLDNLGILARDLCADRDIIQVDLRNHGLSPHSQQMNYLVMAQDLLALLDDLAIAQADLIGHSMGGKVSMAFAALAPERVHRLAILDMAPINYQVRRHDKIFAAINAVSAAQVSQRQQATEIMRPLISEEGVISFLLKSFHAGKWRFNVPALWDNYANIVGWTEIPSCLHPAMFIKGGLSPYIQNTYRDSITRQLPNARAHVIADAGHWLHAEKPEAVLRVLRRFLTE